MERSLLVRVLIFGIALTIFILAHAHISGIEDETSQAGALMILYLLGGAILATMAAAFFIPVISDWVGQFIYSAPEEVKPDAGSKARALVAQGDYEGAIREYLNLAKENSDDRLPVVEAMRLARERLEDVPQAIQIVRGALERPWPEDDAAFFMFRLVEMHDEDLSDRATAKSILEQVIESLPETRHAANARHKLNEWEAEGAAPKA